MTSLDLNGRMYLGLPKPGHAVFEGVVEAGRTAPMVLRSRFFARYLGSECVAVPSAGVTRVAGRLEPRPIAVLTDLLQHDANRPAGLVVEGQGEAAWVGATRLLMNALEKQGVVTLLPSDQHLNPDLLDRAARTSFTLVEDMLYADEKARLRTHPQLAAKATSGTPLTVTEYETIFGNVVDKEDRNFLPHCREGVVEYIPSVLQWLGRQRAAVLKQMDAGAPVPTATVLPDFKTGLSCLSAPDSRGLHGNALRDALIATQRGLYLDGPSRPHAKLALVGGTAHEYSVAELIRFLVDMDYSVVWLLSCTGGLGIAAKLSTALELTERYGTRLFCTYGWPLPAHLGPEPPSWAALASQVEAEDRAEVEAMEKERVRLVQQRVTTQGRPVVTTVDAVEKARLGGTP
ncbi:MAG: hypothetical protein AB2A00_18980 [Myxococcota bacterium]